MIHLRLTLILLFSIENSFGYTCMKGEKIILKSFGQLYLFHSFETSIDDEQNNLTKSLQITLEEDVLKIWKSSDSLFRNAIINIHKIYHSRILSNVISESKIKACGEEKSVQHFALKLQTSKDQKDEAVIHGCNIQSGGLVKFLIKEVNDTNMPIDVKTLYRKSFNVNLFTFKNFTNKGFCFCNDYKKYFDDCVHNEGKKLSSKSDFEVFCILTFYVIVFAAIGKTFHLLLQKYHGVNVA